MSTEELSTEEIIERMLGQRIRFFLESVASKFNNAQDAADAARWKVVYSLPDETIDALVRAGAYERGFDSAECLAFVASMEQRGRTSRGKGRATLALEESILEVLAGFDGPMSSRQVYYQCVSIGAVENNAREALRVGRLLVDLRRAGRVPYDRIVDRTRHKHQAPGWDGAADIMQQVAVQYRRQLWTDQEKVPMVCCEKAALEGIFAQAADQYGASLWTLRGYVSESFAWDWAEEILELNRAGKSVYVFYFGDHDPSGLSIESDARKKLEGFGCCVEWARLGLLASDFDTFDLVNIDVKKTDSRAKVYLSQFGDRAAELDALPPAELQRRITSAIESCADLAAVERCRAIETAERETLRLVAKNWPVASAAAKGAA